MTGIFGKTIAQLEDWCKTQGEPQYRGRQLASWMYSRRRTNFTAMTDLPIPLRERWERDTPIEMPWIEKVLHSKDGSQKYEVRFSDGESVEAVAMPMRSAKDGKMQRNTACISTQVGCALGCTFCATATLGLRRQLTSGEIVGQVLLVQDQIFPRALSRLVLMGMGEPLHNFDAVVQAIGVITGEPGMRLGTGRITLSTVGLVPEIYRLAETGLRVKLAISLNATTDEARDKTMPVNRRYPLSKLMEAAKYYAETTDHRVTFEYVVLAGLNDTSDDAQRLIRLIHGIPCKVNLIPYNPNPVHEFSRPGTTEIERFRDQLYPSCPAVTIRYSKGLDIGAACGQLVTESLRND
jgi:23S rRNA (adenine2503-C2)-methyltransferase